MTEQELRLVLSMNIRWYRTNHNFTQAEFAKKIDISIPFLSDIENGKKWVSPATLSKIAHTLDVEVYELFKPAEILPDQAASIIEKFSADIRSSFEENLNSLCTNYVNNLVNK